MEPENIFSKPRKNYDGTYTKKGSKNFPCIGGAGTLYFSYTDLLSTGTLYVPNDTPIPLVGQNGWLDIQWATGTPEQKLSQLLWTLQSTSIQPGLGPYLWMVLHIGQDQYMVYCIISETDKQNLDTKNYPIQATYIHYTPTETTYDGKTTLYLLQSQLFESIQYIQSLSFTLHSTEYILNTKIYGPCTSYDNNGTIHYDG